MANIRRSRGYTFEHTLVQRLSSGSSLPDDWVGQAPDYPI